MPCLGAAQTSSTPEQSPVRASPSHPVQSSSCFKRHGQNFYQHCPNFPTDWFLATPQALISTVIWCCL